METDEHSDWRSADQRATDVAQAKALRDQASQSGLRFEVYLPASLAKWVLDFVERGVFIDPSEAVFVMLGEQKDLEPHADLREEILRRSLEAAKKETPISTEEFRSRIEHLETKPRAEPAVWHKQKYD